MVQCQKPKKIYNDRRLYFGSGPGMVPNDSFGSASSSTNADRRSGRSRGSFMPPGPPNGTHKPGLHHAGYPMPCFPVPSYHGGPPHPYAIPARSAVHGPVGVVPHFLQPGSLEFDVGLGNTGTPIGSHLPHQQRFSTTNQKCRTNDTEFPNCICQLI